MRKIQPSTLVKKLKKFQKWLNLDGWDIKIRYKSCDPDTVGEIDFCEPVEKTAIINISSKYFTKEGYNVSWNLDNIIIHELIHIELWEQIDRLPIDIKEHKKFKELEEYICFRYAKIIGDMHKRR